jgi:hypothetical protein
MVNTKAIGDFQANVGKISADISLISAYIIAGILIITSIILSVLAFVPMSPGDCDDSHTEFLKRAMEMSCQPPMNSQSICKQAIDDYNNEKDRCNTKTKHYWLLFFLFLIPLAIGIILLARWWQNYTRVNKTAAQIGGTMAEAQFVKSIFN